MGKDRKDGLLWEGVVAECPTSYPHAYVIPAHAGNQRKVNHAITPPPPLWIPAFAGMTVVVHSTRARQ